MKRVLALPAAAALFAIAPAAAAQVSGLCEDHLRMAGKHKDAGDRKEAIRHYRSAFLHCESPRYLGPQAEAMAEDGQLIEARRAYDRILTDPWKEVPAAEVRAARAAAKDRLAKLDLRIPWLRFSVSGAPKEAVRVRVDDKPVTDLGHLDVDPGPHTVVAEADGFVGVTQKLDVREGERDREVALALAPRPRPSAAPAIACFAEGAAGLVLGTVTGVVSFSKVKSLERRCRDGHCLMSDEPAAGTARTLGNVSTAGFVAGSAGVVAGVVLVLLRPKDDAAGSKAGVAPLVGAGWIGLRGNL